jgi:hypothetical protein
MGFPLTHAVSSSRPTRSAAVWVGTASVLLFLISMVWAVVVPVFQAPDEVTHTNSVVRVAQGEGWPRPGEAHVKTALTDAWTLAGGLVDRRRTLVADDRPDPAGTLYFSDVVPTPAEGRASFGELDDGTYETYRDQMTQHPPGYYGVAAAVYDVVGAGDWRYDRAVYLLRALTALMIAATVPACCFVAGRALTGRETVGKIAAFVPLLIPQLQFIGGSVTNDGASIAAASVAWAVLLTITCSGPTRRRLLFLGVAVAAACWTKGTALTLLPCVPLGIALAYRRALGGDLRRWGIPALRAAAGTLTLAFVLGGWWWALNLVRYGRIQPSGAPSPTQDGNVVDRLQFLQIFFGRLRWTFFGEVGVREPAPLAAITLTLALLFIALGVVGLLSRSPIGDRLLMLLAIGLTVGVLFTTTYAAHVTTKGFPGIQGRYLFVLLVPIAVLVASGVVAVADRLRLPGRVLLPGVALAGFAVPVLAVGVAFQIFYVVPGRSWGDAVDLFVSWAPWSPTMVALLVAAVVACGVVLTWQLGRDSRRGRVVDASRAPWVPRSAPDDEAGPSVRTDERLPVTTG